MIYSRLNAVPRCIKFLESNETSQLIFASVTVIGAKDAVPLEVRAGLVNVSHFLITVHYSYCIYTHI